MDLAIGLNPHYRLVQCSACNPHSVGEDRSRYESSINPDSRLYAV